MFRVLPLVAVGLLFGVFALAPVSARIDRWLTQIAFSAFGGDELEYDSGRERLLRSASIGVPYREYATKTRLYTVGIGIGAAVIGVYLGGVIVSVANAASVGGDPAGPLGPGAPARFALSLVFGVVFGVTAAWATRSVRWRVPSIRADARRRNIDAGLPRVVAFAYALTRGGTSFPDVLRTISANEGVFGEGAAEIDVAVRNIDLFNVDLVTAVQDLSIRTPSEQFGTFAENLSSVLQSGGNVPEFLREQYERYRQEAEDRQAEILNVLATTAEVYVTVVVAGMLFLVTILLIIGLTAGDTLETMQILAYVVIPATNVAFLAYLLEITRPLRTSGDERKPIVGSPSTNSKRDVEADGGYTRPNSAINHERISMYRRLGSVRDTLSSPIGSLLARPSLLLYVTVPIAVVVTAVRFTAAVSGGVDVRVLDDLLVEAILFLTGTFAAVHEYRKRRLGRLEASVPDFLDRLASLNEAGVSVVTSFDRVRRNDLGALDDEADRIWRDITWGATIGQALSRFESRVKTPSVTRVVTLLTNAMGASNEIGPVLRIAAEQARSDLRLRRRRKREMFTYLVVIYVSFFVFLIVIAALEYVLIPSLPETGTLDGAGSIGGVDGGDRDAYRLVFFHTALIQSALSGLVAGVMGGGSIKDGMKHVTIMLSVTYAVLALLV